MFGHRLLNIYEYSGRCNKVQIEEATGNSYFRSRYAVSLVIMSFEYVICIPKNEILSSQSNVIINCFVYVVNGVRNEMIAPAMIKYYIVRSHSFIARDCSDYFYYFVLN